ncbi:MAG TPA: secretin N-terminal domain-containing protein [Candidatus Acidoferrales bacterium]|nr:secretin N-terminal domain-containing protein [Candidatus Acidoferrales bacterium]
MRRPLVFALACILATAPIATSPVMAAAPRVSIDVRDADIIDVLRLLATEADASIITDDSVPHDKVTLHLEGVTFMQALTVLAQAYDLQVRNENGVLIVGSSASMNRKYGDDNGPLAAQTVVIPVQNASPDDLVKPLTEALEAGTVVVGDRRTGSLIITGDAPTIQRARRLIAALDAPLGGQSSSQATSIHLNFTRADEAAKQLKGILPDDSYSADDSANIILVTGPPAVLATARALIQAIDVPSPQVMFEVRVADIMSNNDSSNVGAIFGGLQSVNNTINGVSNSGTVQTPQQFNYQITPFVGKTIGVFAQLNAMVSHGEARLLATPRIATLNNQEASILIGTQYPIVTTTSNSGGQNVNISYVDIGVKLRVTPTIGADGSIIAELHPELSTLDAIVESAGSSAPQISDRKVDTTLRIQKDETVVIAGLLRDFDTTTITKFPFLGDIPIFGELFKDRQHTHLKDDVVFLITPHIVQ